MARISDDDPDFEDVPDDPDWEAEALSWVAAQGLPFDRLVNDVAGKIGWNEDPAPVRLWLIGCLRQFERCQIVQADVRNWCAKVSKRAMSLAKLIESQPFPDGSAQSDFLFVSLSDIEYLRDMAVAAEKTASRTGKSALVSDMIARRSLMNLLPALSVGHRGPRPQLRETRFAAWLPTCSLLSRNFPRRTPFLGP